MKFSHSPAVITSRIHVLRLLIFGSDGVDLSCYTGIINSQNGAYQSFTKLTWVSAQALLRL